MGRYIWSFQWRSRLVTTKSRRHRKEMKRRARQQRRDVRRRRTGTIVANVARHDRIYKPHQRYYGTFEHVISEVVGSRKRPSSSQGLAGVTQALLFGRTSV